MPTCLMVMNITLASEHSMIIPNAKSMNVKKASAKSVANILNSLKWRPTISHRGMLAVALWLRTVKCSAAIAIEEKAGSEAKNCRRRLILSVIFNKKYYILSIIFDKIVYLHKQKKMRKVKRKITEGGRGVSFCIRD